MLDIGADSCAIGSKNEASARILGGQTRKIGDSCAFGSKNEPGARVLNGRTRDTDYSYAVVTGNELGARVWDGRRRENDDTYAFVIKIGPGVRALEVGPICAHVARYPGLPRVLLGRFGLWCCLAQEITSLLPWRSCSGRGVEGGKGVVRTLP